jgi:hypothetical protein
MRPGDVYFRGDSDCRDRLAKITNRYLTIEYSGIFYARLANYEKYKNELPDNLNLELKNSVPTPELYQKFVEALLNNLFEVHRQKVAVAKSIDERIEAHASFVWNYISIHPFANGNGRTARMILHWLITQEGLLPPLLTPDDDVLMSERAYIKNVKESIKNTYVFVDDIKMRLRLGLDPKGSPVLLAPRLFGDITLNGAKKNKKEYFYIDLFDYAEFSRRQDQLGGYSDEKNRLIEYYSRLENMEWFMKQIEAS